MRILALIYCVFLGLAMVSGAAGAEDAPTLIVTGEGKATARPDMATVRLGVQEEARAAEAAMAAASKAAASILATLDAAGVAEEDIQTTRIGLDPRYDRPTDGAPPRITGYIATNDLAVRVRDLDGLGDILDGALSSGANSFRGISFGVSETETLGDQARADAVRDAGRRASVLADAAGMTLGPILSITEGGGVAVPSPVMRGAMMAEASSIPVAEGQIDVTARVTIVFALEP